MRVIVLLCLAQFWLRGPASVVWAVAPSTQAPPNHKPAAVSVVEVVRQPIRRTTTQPATVHAFYSAEIAGRVEGYAARVLADIGDRVERGQLLAEIGAPELVQQLAVADAVVANAAAQLARREAGVQVARARLKDAAVGVETSRTRVAAAGAALATADAELYRTRQMVESNALQERLLDESRGRRGEAAADQRAAELVVSQREAGVGVARAELEAAQAELAAAKTLVELAEAQRAECRARLGFCSLRAPFGGTVTARHVDPGDRVRASAPLGRPPLFVLSRTDRVRVRVRVPEADAPLVDVGDPAEVRLAAVATPVAGSVTRAARALHPGTRTMMVEIELDNASGSLLPGMYGEARIVLHESPEALSLPASAVRFTGNGAAFVYRLGKGNSVATVAVQLGADTGGRIQITAPLAAGDRVIDAHLRRFAEGETVRVIDEGR